MKFSISILIAIFALSGVIAEVASAETTSLAEVLANGSEITTKLNVETIGAVKLEDTETIAGKAAVKCSAILDGSVGANGSWEVTKFLNLAKEEIGALGGLALLGTGAGSDCQTVSGCAEGSASSPIEVYPLGLPWKAEIVLMENGEFLGLGAATENGFEILCLVLGINTEDKCTSTGDESGIENGAGTGDAETPTGSKMTPNYACTQSGGKLTGVIERSENSTNKLESGELLTVSM